MCGIGGYSLARGDACRINRAALTRSLLTTLETRGRDAAGVAWRDARGGAVWVHKDRLNGRRFADDLDPASRYAGACIVHTRWATKGDPGDDVNNHPIDVGGVVGVHNGVITNDDEIFGLVGGKRHGEVDSEAAFALLARGPAVLGEADPAELVGLLRGTVALAWLVPDEDRPSLYLARGAGSPLHVGWTEGGTLIFASTPGAVTAAAKAAGAPIVRRRELPEGVVLRVAGGKVRETWKYEPDSAGRRAGHGYDRLSRYELDTDDWSDEVVADDDDDDYGDWQAANDRALEADRTFAKPGPVETPTLRRQHRAQQRQRRDREQRDEWADTAPVGSTRRRDNVSRFDEPFELMRDVLR